MTRCDTDIAQTNQKRPARPQQPEVYLEPNWLRYPLVDIAFHGHLQSKA